VGRPEAVTDANRTVVWRAQNLAFTRNVTVASLTLNLGFPGQYYDAETGDWNNGFRDYDSLHGRYVESDPIGLSGGVNTYAYVGDDPIATTDVLGLCGCKKPKDVSRMNNPNLNKNMLRIGAAGAAVGIVALNVIGFPEAEAGEGAAAITFTAVGEVDGATALEFLNGLGGEPIAARFVVSLAGAATGFPIGATIGFFVTPPKSADCLSR